MKRIYTVTLDDDVPLSDNTIGDIRAIAFWVYDEFSKFNKQILCIDEDKEVNDSGLIKNELYDVASNGKYIYKFTSDIKPLDKRMYEPFVLNNRSFGFTVYDGSVSDAEVAIILQNVLTILKLNYKFNIDSIVYDDKNIKNRFAAIDKIMNKKEEEIQTDTKRRVKLRFRPIVSILGL